MRALATRGGRADEPDAFGATALDYACGAGHADAVRACLAAGADALGDALGLGELFVTRRNQKTRVGLTPPETVPNPYLNSASVSRVVPLLSLQTDAAAASAYERSTRATNAFRGATEAEALACSASRPLVLAASRGHVDVVQALLDHVGEGPPLDRLLAAADSRGRSPLHAACSAAQSRVAKVLVQAGAWAVIKLRGCLQDAFVRIVARACSLC